MGSFIYHFSLGPTFVSLLLESFRHAMETQLHLSTSYHPQIDGHIKMLNQVLDDMLKACMVNFKGSWEVHLWLMELCYNNIFQILISIEPYEALYGQLCQSLWLDPG